MNTSKRRYHANGVYDNILIFSLLDPHQSPSSVCTACHSENVVESHYKQFDDLVDLYNEKFAKPIAAIMKDLKAEGYISKSPFDDKIEWIWWEIWHHEGRHAG